MNQVLPVGRDRPLQPDEADTHNESERAHGMLAPMLFFPMWLISYLCDQPLSICVTLWVAALGQHCTAPSYFSKGSSHTERYSHAQSETCEAEKSS